MYRRETVFKITVVDRYMVYIFSVVILFSLIFIPRISVAKPTFTLHGWQAAKQVSPGKLQLGETF